MATTTTKEEPLGTIHEVSLSDMKETYWASLRGFVYRPALFNFSSNGYLNLTLSLVGDICLMRKSNRVHQSVTLLSTPRAPG